MAGTFEELLAALAESDKAIAKTSVENNFFIMAYFS